MSAALAAASSAAFSAVAANSSARRDLRVELRQEQPVADGERGGQPRGDRPSTLRSLDGVGVALLFDADHRAGGSSRLARNRQSLGPPDPALHLLQRVQRPAPGSRHHQGLQGRDTAGASVNCTVGANCNPDGTSWVEGSARFGKVFSGLLAGD